MDAINEALSSTRVGQAYVRRIRQAGPWGLRFPAFVGVGFHVIRRGSGWLVTATDEPVAVQAGDVVFAAHGTEHGLSSSPRALLGELPLAPMGDGEANDPDPAEIEFLCGAYRLDHGHVHPYLRRMPDIVSVSPDYGRYGELSSLANLLDADVARSRPGDGITRPALVDLLLVHVMRLWQDEQSTTGQDIGDAVIAAALHEIHTNPQTPWTVHRLSELAGISRTTFTRRFTLAVGTPPKTYLMTWRLLSGAQLLRETEAPLASIARQVGYSSEFAFASAFRREFGIPPGRFRLGDRKPDPGRPGPEGGQAVSAAATSPRPVGGARTAECPASRAARTAASSEATGQERQAQPDRTTTASASG